MLAARADANLEGHRFPIIPMSNPHTELESTVEPLPFLLLVLCLLWEGRGGTEILRGIPEPKALCHMAQMERLDVEDVLEAGWVGCIRPDERLQSWREKGGRKMNVAIGNFPLQKGIMCHRLSGEIISLLGHSSFELKLTSKTDAMFTKHVQKASHIPSNYQNKSPALGNICVSQQQLKHGWFSELESAILH